MSKTKVNMPRSENLGSEIYDEKGNLLYSVVNQGGKMVYRAGPNLLSPEEQITQAAAKKAAASTLTGLEANRGSYAESAQQLADARTRAIMGDVNREYDTGLRKLYENQSARGMSGSRAAADAIAEVERARGDTASRVSSESNVMRDQLLNQRIGQDIGLYNFYSGVGQQGQNRLASYYGMGSGGMGQAMGLYGQDSVNAMAKYRVAQEQDPWSKYIMPTLSTGAQVYGAFRGGK